MAHYLVTKDGGDYDLVLTHVEAKSIPEAIESLELGDGESVKVYRMAGDPRIVRIHEEVVRKVEVE